tara:strand:- start:464 stop:1474 length:1011 start_codon:yes stop_codon:yes gene_type:complete
MLSIIIPTLNEEQHIQKLLLQLSAQRNVSFEIIVSDGGSKDATLKIAKDIGAVIVSGEPGRGKQLNKGAQCAKGEYFLFLHADSGIENKFQLKDSLDFIKGLSEPSAGHFKLNFFCDDPKVKKFLSFFEWKSSYNRDGTFSGDQGLLISKENFDKLGRFSEAFTFLEDKEFALRFSRIGNLVTLPGEIETSGRRFEAEGPLERSTLNLIIMSMFHLRLFDFFVVAPSIYREASDSKRLDLFPFFQNALHQIFGDGFFRAIFRFGSLGSWANANGWQIFLWLGAQSNNPQKFISIYDRFFFKLSRNMVGDIFVSLIITGWFFLKLFTTWIRFRLKGR